MKIIIAGSRGYTNYKVLKLAVKKSKFNITEIISGHCPNSPDMLGELYADEFDIPLTVLKPDWKKHGRAAGFIRNKDMGNYGEGLIALWDNTSRGTLDMINYMKSLGKPSYVHLV